MYRRCILKLYTSYLYNVINQFYLPINLIFKIAFNDLSTLLVEQYWGQNWGETSKDALPIKDIQVQNGQVHDPEGDALLNFASWVPHLPHPGPGLGSYVSFVKGK